jgi:hypothetical protein
MDGLNDAVDGLMDDEMWVEAAAIGGGFLGSSLAQSTIEGSLPFDVPNEAYGVAVAGGFLIAGDTVPYHKQMAMGGGLYTLDSLAQRADIKQRVTDLGGN